MNRSIPVVMLALATSACVFPDMPTTQSPDGKNRVLIVDRGGGRFGFDEEYFSEDPDERCWVPLPQYPLTICDTAESAEREARASVDRLRDASDAPRGST